MHDDERLEGDGPRRVAQSILQNSEYFADPSFAAVRGDENVLDILRLRRSELDHGGQRQTAKGS